MKDSKKITLKYKSINTHSYRDMNGYPCLELMIAYEYEADSVLKNSSFFLGPFYVRTNLQQVILRVPIVHDTLKLFYSNYKDYYYLPAEDSCVLKSVASGVDQNHRMNAKKETCYTKYTGFFIPTIHNSNQTFRYKSNDQYGYTIFDVENINYESLIPYGEEIILHLFDRRKNSF